MAEGSFGEAEQEAVNAGVRAVQAPVKLYPMAKLRARTPERSLPTPALSRPARSGACPEHSRRGREASSDEKVSMGKLDTRGRWPQAAWSISTKPSPSTPTSFVLSPERFSTLRACPSRTTANCQLGTGNSRLSRAAPSPRPSSASTSPPDRRPIPALSVILSPVEKSLRTLPQCYFPPIDNRPAPDMLTQCSIGHCSTSRHRSSGSASTGSRATHCVVRQ